MGRAVREFFGGSVKTVEKSGFSQGVAIDKSGQNYVVICKFTGVARIMASNIVKNTT
jgi:hypothetical protein